MKHNKIQDEILCGTPRLEQISCQSSVVETSAPVTPEVPGSISGQTRHSCNIESASLRQRRFPPGSPVSSHIKNVAQSSFDEQIQCLD